MTLHQKFEPFFGAFILMIVFSLCHCSAPSPSIRADISHLKSGFQNPPDSARPGVYWYFMDGNLSKEAMTADLASMKEVGIGNLIFLEVNVGVPRGPVDFLSEEWQALFKHAVREAERLGIVITLGVGPGWTGSGGPWVNPAQSMQHLVASTLQVSGPATTKVKLPVPAPKKPYFGEGVFTPDLEKQWKDFYEDVAVLAFPSSGADSKIADIDEKALYYRAPYTSVPGVKPYLPSLAEYPDLPKDAVVQKDRILNLTDSLQPDGTLSWNVPAGQWTIMRFGKRNNGAVTRPAPFPGLGFECDKFDTVALNAHLDHYTGALLRSIGTLDSTAIGGLKMLHMDSWEMGSQNWTARFREEFRKRRGYDPLPFYPVYAGNMVESLEVSERFLWDLRLTSQELVLDYHARHLKKYSHTHGFGLSIEPYDMNPNADLALGAVADVPMCEFWSNGFGYDAAFSCIEATSIAHVNGLSVVAAEAFTAESTEAWQQHPASMKNQGDWAFATGINRLVYHTFAHKPLGEDLRPGMTMGPYGVHWDRGQTWWPLVADYHRYISRCQYILQQGRTVADILYLTPEGAPHVFRPPSSALAGDEFMPDRKGYNFDGCSPDQLFQASVQNNQIFFPGGATYQLLVLPMVETMTPELLEKIRSLTNDGATVIGLPPQKSPSLSGYPDCDQKVKTIVQALWGGFTPPASTDKRAYGQGKIIWGGVFSNKEAETLYPGYEPVAALLKEMGREEDFIASAPIRYTHRTTADWDIYFVANRTSQSITSDAVFRTTQGNPECWDPLTGETRKLPEFSVSGTQTTIPLQFEPYQSFFIVFEKGAASTPDKGKNFPEKIAVDTLQGPWQVSFDPQWGGPKEKVVFAQLADWTTRPEEGIKYYSGIAIYRNTFDISEEIAADPEQRLYLDAGTVKNIARVRLNGQDLGVVWTAPWQVDVTGAVKQGTNQLEIEVANLWPNRLIGDEQLPDDGISNGQWPAWLVEGKERSSGRYTFTTHHFYTAASALMPSGLMGPVTLLQSE